MYCPNLKVKFKNTAKLGAELIGEFEPPEDIGTSKAVFQCNPNYRRAGTSAHSRIKINMKSQSS